MLNRSPVHPSSLLKPPSCVSMVRRTQLLPVSSNITISIIDQCITKVSVFCKYLYQKVLNNFYMYFEYVLDLLRVNLLLFCSIGFYLRLKCIALYCWRLFTSRPTHSFFYEKLQLLKKSLFIIEII